MERNNEKIDIKLKESFKKEFNKERLDKDFYQRLALKIEAERMYEETLKGRIKTLLEREIEIDIRGVIAAAVFMIMLSSVVSLKEIDKEYREKMVLNNIVVLNKERGK